MINFYKGKSSKVNGVPAEAILFTTDTNEIIVDKLAYGKTTHADESKTTAPIVVAGGPLADSSILDAWPTDAAWNLGGNKVIPSGTSIQDVLKKLFLKSRNGSAEWGDFTWNPSLGNPTVTFQMKDASNNNVTVPNTTTVVEVGTTLYAKVETNNTVNNNVRSITCDCDEGYFLSATSKDWYPGDYTHSEEGDSEGNLTTSYSIKVTPPGGTATTTSITQFTSETTPITIEYGKNEFIATQSGITATVDALDQVDVYPSTNEKTVISTASKSPKDNSTDEDRTEQLTSNGSDTIQGSYYYFVGQVSKDTTITSDVIRGLANSKGTASTDNSTRDFVYNLTTAPILNKVTINAGNTYIIAVPDDYQMTDILFMGSPVANLWSTTTVTVSLPYGTKDYTVYYTTAGDLPISYTNLKLGKK